VVTGGVLSKVADIGGWPKCRGFDLNAVYLKAGDTTFLKALIILSQIARQLIQCGRLGQFRLASRLLYSG
jgi:hypothetical protein